MNPATSTVDSAQTPLTKADIPQPLPYANTVTVTPRNELQADYLRFMSNAAKVQLFVRATGPAAEVATAEVRPSSSHPTPRHINPLLTSH